jgi:hypothetical protein
MEQTRGRRRECVACSFVSLPVARVDRPAVVVVAAFAAVGLLRIQSAKRAE